MSNRIRVLTFVLPLPVLLLLCGGITLAQTQSTQTASIQTQSGQTQTTRFGEPPILLQTPRVDEIVVEGADDILAGLIKVTIDTEIGQTVSSINLEDLRAQILELGFFKEVKTTFHSAEARNTLIISVTLNPSISKFVFVGNSVVSTDELVRFLDEQLNLASGTVLNTTRLVEARDALVNAYRQVVPFIPNIDYEVGPAIEGRVNVTFRIDESAPIKSVSLSGATLVPSKELEDLFKPLLEKGTFEANLYANVTRAVADRYNRLGYRGSGVGPSTELRDGALNIVIRELKIAAIDATALGINPETLTLKPGDFFNYDRLLEDVARFAQNKKQQIGLDIESVSSDTVAISFSLSETPTGPIERIEIEGNTVVSDEAIIAKLRQKRGDTFNTTLATTLDTEAVADAYDEAGYPLVSIVSSNFTDGVYRIQVQEPKVVGYEVAWRGDHLTRDFVLTREFPEPGWVFGRAQLQRAFSNLQRSGLLRDLQLRFRTPDPEKPAEIILILDAEEGQTGRLEPAIGFSTLDGWNGSFAYEQSNLFGLAHSIRVNIQAGQNDAGQALSGGISYVIPWLYVDFLDLQRTPTSLSFSVYSNVVGNKVIERTRAVDDPNTPLDDRYGPDDPNTPNVDESLIELEPRKFTTRKTGFGITVGRPFGTNFRLSLALSLNYEERFLENKSNARYFMPNNDLVNALIDPSSFSPFIELRPEFSTKNSGEFPTAGIVASGGIGYGFGSQGSKALSWLQLTTGFRGYLGFGWSDAGEFGFGPGRNMALAFRLDTGGNFGTAPTGQQFSIGGSITDQSTLRGYDFGVLQGDLFYTGSLEYRLDFGLKTAVTNGLLAVAFVDFGNAWGNGSRTFQDADKVNHSISEGIQFGYGIGLQINLGFNNSTLAALRFDYGFSPYNPSGKFYFRFGYPF